MHNVPPFYGLADGRIWSVGNAAFVEAGDASLASYRASGGQLGTAPDSAGELTVTGLREVLEFYDLPLGVLMPLSEAQTAKRALINAGHEAALAGAVALSDPTPSTVAVEAGLLAASDPEGLEFVRNALAARRNELLAAVEAAKTAEAVQAIVVSYAV